MEQLKGIRALQGFSMQQLAKLAAEGEERDAEIGECLFREDEESKELIFLLEGSLEAKCRGKHLADILALSVVGELGVLGNEPRSATVCAAETSSYLSIAREDFQRLIEEDPDLGLKFYRNLCSLLAAQLKKKNLLVEFFQALS